MKTTLVASSILFGIMGLSAVNAATNTPIGAYSCIGNSASGNKPIKGTLVVTKSPTKADESETVFTYDSGKMDVGTLKAAKVPNVYIERWHSVSGSKEFGLGQFTFGSDGGIAIQYVLIEHSTGQFTSGTGTCKPAAQ